MSEVHNIEVVPVDSIEAAADGADIVDLCAPGHFDVHEPLVDIEQVKSGALVISMAAKQLSEEFVQACRVATVNWNALVHEPSAAPALRRPHREGPLLPRRRHRARPHHGRPSPTRANRPTTASYYDLTGGNGPRPLRRHLGLRMGRLPGPGLNIRPNRRIPPPLVAPPHRIPHSPPHARHSCEGRNPEGCGEARLRPPSPPPLPVVGAPPKSFRPEPVLRAHEGGPRAHPRLRKLPGRRGRFANRPPARAGPHPDPNPSRQTRPTTPPIVVPALAGTQGRCVARGVSFPPSRPPLPTARALPKSVRPKPMLRAHEGAPRAYPRLRKLPGRRGGSRTARPRERATGHPP